MAESSAKAVTLGGALAGKSVLVDLDLMTVGTLEDMEAGTVTKLKAALCSLIVGGDFGEGEALAAALRRMKVAEFQALSSSILNLILEKKQI